MNKQMSKRLASLLVVTGVALSACSTTQTPKHTEAHPRTQVSAEALERAFASTTLSHREQGAIAATSFEADVRNAVREQLDIDFEHLTKIDYEQLLRELQQADAHLATFKHASHRGSDLTQLWALLPALPTLERRKALQLAFRSQFQSEEHPALANERMAEMMDLQLNRLFGGFTISLDALTPETEAFEDKLVAGLKQEGLNISARRPSLILEYFIDAYDVEGETEVIADFEFKDRSAQTFHALSNMTTYPTTAEESAQQAAFNYLADDIAEQLLNKALTRIQNVNQVK